MRVNACERLFASEVLRDESPARRRRGNRNRNLSLGYNIIL